MNKILDKMPENETYYKQSDYENDFEFVESSNGTVYLYMNGRIVNL